MYSVPMSNIYNVFYSPLQQEESPVREEVLTDRTPPGEKMTS